MQDIDDTVIQSIKKDIIINIYKFKIYDTLLHETIKGFTEPANSRIAERLRYTIDKHIDSFSSSSIIESVSLIEMFYLYRDVSYFIHSRVQYCFNIDTAEDAFFMGSIPGYDGVDMLNFKEESIIYPFLNSLIESRHRLLRIAYNRFLIESYNNQHHSETQKTESE